MPTFAIVGSGVTGLCAARVLCGKAKAGDEIVLLEAGDRAGGHACTVAVGGDGSEVPETEVSE